MILQFRAEVFEKTSDKCLRNFATRLVKMYNIIMHKTIWKKANSKFNMSSNIIFQLFWWRWNIMKTRVRENLHLSIKITHENCVLHIQKKSKVLHINAESHQEDCTACHADGLNRGRHLIVLRNAWSLDHLQVSHCGWGRRCEEGGEGRASIPSSIIAGLKSIFWNLKKKLENNSSCSWKGFSHKKQGKKISDQKIECMSCGIQLHACKGNAG